MLYVVAITGKMTTNVADVTNVVEVVRKVLRDKIDKDNRSYLQGIFLF